MGFFFLYSRCQFPVVQPDRNARPRRRVGLGFHALAVLTAGDEGVAARQNRLRVGGVERILPRRQPLAQRVMGRAGG
jgi:hypothetical protein